MSKGIKLLITGVASSGKSSTLRSLKDAYVIYADTKKAFPFSMIHTNVYTYREFTRRKKVDGKFVTVNEIPEKAIEYSGMDEFLKAITAKLALYKKAKGELPKTIAFDAITNIYKMVSDYVTSTTKNVYGSHSADTARDTDKLLSWIERELIGRGINVVLLAHVVINRETEVPQIATSGSKMFENTGGFLGSVNYASYVYTDKDGTRMVSNNDAQYASVSRSLLQSVVETETLEEFNLQEMLNRIAQESVDVSSMEF